MKTLSKIAGLGTGVLLWLLASVIITGALLFVTPGLPVLIVFILVAACVLMTGLVELPKSSLYSLSQIGARMMFDNAKQLMQDLNYDITHAKLTQSFLRSEVVLSATQAAYHIPLLVNDTQNGSVRVLEKRLNLQDIFVTNQIAVLIGVGASTNTKSPLFSYPDATTFTSATDEDLMSVYNGSLSLIINNDQVLPAWDVLRHYKVPAIQALAALYYASSPTQLNQLDLSEDGFYPVEPGLVLNGAANLQMQIQCPGAPATVLSNSFICVIQRGILLQNVTTVK